MRCAFRHFGLVVMLCLPLTSVSCLPGQRLLTIQIEVEGNPEYEGVRGVPDSTPVAQMWDVLGDVRFKPTTTKASSQNAAPLDSQVLEGAIVVRIMHVNDELATASRSKLTLRYDDATDAWKLEQTEVERIRDAAME